LLTDEIERRVEHVEHVEEIAADVRGNDESTETTIEAEQSREQRWQ
jgi:hypothetical protein